MSGTSLDGLDLCAARLQVQDGKWNYELVAAQCFAYSQPWLTQLSEAFVKRPDELQSLDAAFGALIGARINEFCESEKLNPDLIASHGHTVHHKPSQGYTRQIGSPRAIAATTGLPVVADFRSLDVTLGGEGAPLVPIADRLLFGEYAQCVNLGGIFNLSYERAAERIAYDVTVGNQLLNRLANRLGGEYDQDGAWARSGTPDAAVVQSFRALRFHALPAPKSLGREWFESSVWPLFRELAASSPRDALATATHAIAEQLAVAVSRGPAGKVLLTGGGARNTYLVSLVRRQLVTTHQLALPPTVANGISLIDYKEALAFALLGALRVRGEVNTLRSVTGAQRDSCGGELVLPKVSSGSGGC